MTAGDVKSVSEAFTYPHPVYFGEDVQIVPTLGHSVKHTQEYLDKLKSNGTSKVVVLDFEVVSKEDGRCCLRVVWGYQAADGTFLASTHNELFFCLEDDGDVKICQINILASSNAVLRKYYDKAYDRLDA